MPKENLFFGKLRDFAFNEFCFSKVRQSLWCCLSVCLCLCGDVYAIMCCNYNNNLQILINIRQGVPPSKARGGQLVPLQAQQKSSVAVEQLCRLKINVYVGNWCLHVFGKRQQQGMIADLL